MKQYMKIYIYVVYTYVRISNAHFTWVCIFQTPLAHKIYVDSEMNNINKQRLFYLCTLI